MQNPVHFWYATRATPTISSNGMERLQVCTLHVLGCKKIPQILAAQSGRWGKISFSIIFGCQWLGDMSRADRTTRAKCGMHNMCGLRAFFWELRTCLPLKRGNEFHLDMRCEIMTFVLRDWTPFEIFDSQKMGECIASPTKKPPRKCPSQYRQC